MSRVTFSDRKLQRREGLDIWVRSKLAIADVWMQSSFGDAPSKDIRASAAFKDLKMSLDVCFVIHTGFAVYLSVKACTDASDSLLTIAESEKVPTTVFGNLSFPHE